MSQEFGLFDQFQQSQVYQGPSRRTAFGGPGYSDPFRRSQDSSGYSTGNSTRDRRGSDPNTLDDQPIFKKVKTFNVTKLEEQISHVTVSDEKVVYVQGHQIWQYDLRKKTNTPAELPKKTAAIDDKVSKIFQDPTGQHVIISTAGGENYYLEGGKGSKKLKHLSKLRGVCIESVAWCLHRETTDQSTHPILLGTSKGVLLETEIEPQNEELMKALKKQMTGGSLEKYVKELHVVDQEKAEQVTGLLLQPFENDKRRFISIVTTPNRIFQFIGDLLNDTPTYGGLFTNRPLAFHEIPGNLSYSNFCTWAPNAFDVPKKFSWLTGAGVYFGILDFTNRDAKSVTLDCELIPLKQVNRQNPDSYPLYICMTEFHCILAYRDRFEAVSLLNMQVVFQDNVSNRSVNHRGMCRDPMTGDVWLYSEKHFNRYIIQNEIRDVWRCFLEKGDYDTAKKYCRRNTYQMDRVNRAQAESFFKRSHFNDAAECYAQTSISFEEVALKFIQADDQTALKLFLLRRLQQLGDENQTQVTLLSCWLIELMLNQISVLRDQLSSPQTTSLGHQTTMLDRSQREAGLKEATAEFRSLLDMKMVKQSLDVNRNTAYELLLGHGDTENLLYFATLMQDYERVINHHLSQNQYQHALLMLREQRNKELYYKFIPVLMKHNPEETVVALKESGPLLNPKKLIPALVQCSQYWKAEQSEHVLEYLEFVVNSLNNRSTSIHNFLISLYCKLRKQEKLISYLEQDWNRITINYDPEYALRLCAEHKMSRACVIIYIILELYHEAVELALDVDIELAKMAANRPENDKDLRKKLWLKIAWQMLQKNQDVAETMQSLDFGELLKIEDILPFFPDFQTIDHFRDVICRTLETYNKEIHDLKEEMTEAQDSARNIRHDIIEVRNRCGVITSSKRCDKCAYSILSTSFFLFPCQHVFHVHCLQDEYLRMASEERKQELQILLDKKQNLRGFEVSTASQQNAEKLPTEFDLVQDNIEDILANDCVYCGALMIATIDRSFYTEATNEEITSWNL